MRFYAYKWSCVIQNKEQNNHTCLITSPEALNHGHPQYTMLLAS